MFKHLQGVSSDGIVIFVHLLLLLRRAACWEHCFSWVLGLCLSRRCLTTSEHRSQLPNKTWAAPLLLAGPQEKVFQQTLFELLERASRGQGWNLSCGSAVSPAPLMRQVQGLCSCQLAGTEPPWRKGSSPRAEQVFSRRLCWDFLRDQAMHALSEIC